MSVQGESCHGGKQSKERITVMFCANMDGSIKYKPLVIGKFQNPRCFRGVKALPIDYDANKKAWMTTELYEKWLVSFDRKMKREKRKALLFVDNCSAHDASSLRLEAVTVRKLPPNTTSVLQPMDQGIINNFKVYYRKRIVQRLIVNIESEDPDKITVKDAIDMVDYAWRQVKKETIANCFRKAGFVHVHEDECIIEAAIEDSCVGTDELWETLRTTNHLSPPSLTFEQFITADDNILVSYEPTDAEILDSVRVQSEEDQYDTCIDEQDDDPPLKIPSGFEALRALQCVRNFFQCGTAEELPSDITIGLRITSCHQL